MTSQWVPMRLKVPQYNVTGDDVTDDVVITWNYDDLPRDANYYVKEGSNKVVRIKEPKYTLV